MKVYVRTAAREDILRQYSYYLDEKDAPRAAQRFLDAVESAIEMLCRMPEGGSPRFFGNPNLTGMRSWPVSGFPAMKLYHILAGEDIHIVRILHGKRDINLLLEEDASEEGG